MRYKGGPLKKAAMFIGGSTLTAVGTVMAFMPYPAPPGIPILVIGLPMLMKSYRPSRIYLSKIRDKFGIVDKVFTLSGKGADWKRIRDLGIMKEFRDVVRITHPRLSQKFNAERALQAERQAQPSPLIHQAVKAPTIISGVSKIEQSDLSSRPEFNRAHHGPETIDQHNHPPVANDDQPLIDGTLDLDSHLNHASRKKSL